MKASNDLWKERLEGALSPALAEEVAEFETQMELRRQGKVDEKVFAETRLRRGTYGQRYDNGQRHDGSESRTLPYDEKNTKGPHTMWDAPGMQRIKIPYGGLNPAQLEVMAELAEEYSDGIAHITTRQDFQLHFIHIDDTPALMRRLAAAGITTREACGNSVRNVTGCPYAGICRDEAFDVSPYAAALSKFLLGHPDAQGFGRKFKPTFSGCAQHACGLTALHDLGYTAVTREENGRTVRGFKVTVGGGLGSVPHQARVFDDFLPVSEMLPIAQAMARVFARHGEKTNRARARIKFLIKDWGVEKFREEVLKERANLKTDPRWLEFIADAEKETEGPLRDPGTLPALNGDARFNHWADTNVRLQRQEGYATVTVCLPLGDLTSDQLRSLADIVRKYTRGTIRTTVEQNFVIRWVSLSDLKAIYDDLHAARLSDPGAGSIVDIVTCPGTDTCKLGVASSRGLGAELKRRLTEKGFELDAAIRNLHIKISGCFNSCGQHHVCDIGFFGVSRNVQSYKVPHFQVMLGGLWEENAGSYGLPIIAIPSKRIPDVIDRLADAYLKGREGNERFTDFVRRIGKKEVRGLLEGFTTDLPSHDEDPDFYSDWADPREFTTGDIGTGECAGEVVSQYEFAMLAVERMIFDSQVRLDEGDAAGAARGAFAAMLRAARALVQLQYDDVEDDEEEIIDEFRERFFDTELFHDTYAGPKFANYFFDAAADKARKHTHETAHHLIEETVLFVEAVHTCYNKLRVHKPAGAEA